MKLDIKHYQILADQMIAADRDRDQANAKYDDMYKSQWSLPAGINELDWVRKAISTDPHDAIAAGTRVLSTLAPQVRIQPTAPGEGTKKKVNEWERALKWALKAADRRRMSSIIADVVKSALLYDEVVVNVIDLDYQIKQKQMMKGDTKRLNAARRAGRFVVNVYHPKDVHVRYSNMGAEAVLLVKKMSAKNLISEWGELASKHTDLVAMTDPEVRDDEVTLYDYTDWNMRCVWVSAEKSSPVGEAYVIIGPEPHNLDFLPWAAQVGGSALEDNQRFKRQPILFSVLNSGQWETQNVIRTLYTSEVIAHAAAPRLKEEGPMPKSTSNTDYGDPNKPIKVTPGNKMDQMSPPPIDSALAEIDDRIGQSIDKATVSRILQNAEPGSGMAYATLNLATQTAVGALKPAKSLSEKTIAEILYLIMMWIRYTKKSFTAYGAGKKDSGVQYTIEPDEIDPEALFIEAELIPDVPTDRQQRANTAALLVESVDYPIERALEDVGVEDPQEAIKARYLERLVRAKLDTMIEQQRSQMQMQLQMEMQTAMMQMQMGMQQAQAQAQQQAMMPMQGASMPGPPPPGMEDMMGQGMNPAAGGLPPGMGNPTGNLREEVSGMDREGNPLGGLL